MLRKLLLAGAALAFATGAASAKELKSVGITLSSLGNPFFVALAKGAEAKAEEINPNVKVISASADYDLNKQFNQIDNFVASGVDLILLNAADPKAIISAVKRAQQAGVVVVGVDVAAAGADATVQTNNVQAGEIACKALADKIGNKGNVIIQNGPQVSAVIDRVKGCKDVLAKQSGIKILSDDQDGKGNREGGLNIMQGHLTRFPDIAGVFAINDPQAIGSDLAIKQLNRKEITVTSVDGAPDIEAALKGDTSIIASASQDPLMAQQACRGRLRRRERQEAGTTRDPDALDTGARETTVTASTRGSTPADGDRAHALLRNLRRAPAWSTWSPSRCSSTSSRRLPARICARRIPSRRPPGAPRQCHRGLTRLGISTRSWVSSGRTARPLPGRHARAAGVDVSRGGSPTAEKPLAFDFPPRR